MIEQDFIQHHVNPVIPSKKIGCGVAAPRTNRPGY